MSPSPEDQNQVAHISATGGGDYASVIITEIPVQPGKDALKLSHSGRSITQPPIPPPPQREAMQSKPLICPLEANESVAAAYASGSHAPDPNRSDGASQKVRELEGFDGKNAEGDTPAEGGAPRTVINDEALSVVPPVEEYADEALCKAGSDAETEPHERYMQKIQQQQQDLDRLRDTCDRQTRQICQLTMQMTEYKAEVDTAGANVLFTENQGLLESLRKQENDISVLQQRLEEESVAAQEAYEARCTIQEVHQSLSVQEQLAENLRRELTGARLEVARLREVTEAQKEDFMSWHVRREEKLHPMLIARGRSERGSAGSSDRGSSSAEVRDESELRGGSLEILCATMRSSPPANRSPRDERSLSPTSNYCSVLPPAQNGKQFDNLLLLDKLEELEKAEKLTSRKMRCEITELQKLLKRERLLRTKAEEECQRLMSEILDIQKEKKSARDSESDSDQEEPIQALAQATSSSTYAPQLASHMLQLQTEIQRLRNREESHQKALKSQTSVINHLIRKYGLTEEAFRAPVTSRTQKQSKWGEVFGGKDMQLTLAQANRALEETLLENIRLRTDMALLAANVQEESVEAKKNRAAGGDNSGSSPLAAHNPEIVLFDADVPE